MIHFRGTANPRCRVRHHCIDCGAEYLTGFHPFCAACGGMVDVEYDLAAVQLVPSDNPYIRFADLLPVRELRHRFPETRYTPWSMPGRWVGSWGSSRCI